MCFRRAFAVVGATPEDLVHVSFPLGIHPVAHLYARAAEDLGIGTIWCGAGANTPSLTQLELIRDLKPTIWAGMGSYGLHLANLAEAHGFDLASMFGAPDHRGRRTAVAGQTAEARARLGRGSLRPVRHDGGRAGLGAVARHDGLHVWSDLFYCEVVDETTGEPVPEGEVGTLAITSLFNNNVTPFLRWNSGDLISITSQGSGDGPWSLFPVMRHARRTVGFFKVRGVNINHNELEDLMFYDANVQDFKAEVVATDKGLDLLRLLIEPRRGVDTAASESDNRRQCAKDV